MIVLASLWLALPAFGPTGQLTPVQEAVSDMTRGLFRLEQVLHPVRAVHIASSSGELAMSLLLPALWIFSLARALRAARPVLGVRLVRVLGSINRGMRTTGRAMRRHGSATCWRSSGRWLRSPRPACRVSSIVHLEGTDDVDALRWTAMSLTSRGSDYWPQPAERRMPCFALVALRVRPVRLCHWDTVERFHPSAFVCADAEENAGEVADAKASATLHAEVQALRAELRQRPAGGEAG